MVEVRCKELKSFCVLQNPGYLVEDAWHVNRKRTEKQEADMLLGRGIGHKNKGRTSREHPPVTLAPTPTSFTKGRKQSFLQWHPGGFTPGLGNTFRRVSWCSPFYGSIHDAKHRPLQKTCSGRREMAQHHSHAGPPCHCLILPATCMEKIKDVSKSPFLVGFPPSILTSNLTPLPGSYGCLI